MLRMSDDAAEAKFGARPNGTKSLGDGSQDVPRLLDALQTAEADRDALARKIAAAPHAYGSCGLFGEKCHCWKADTGDAAHQGHDGAAS